MGVRLIVDPTVACDAVAMYCSTSGFAFGPVFDNQEDAEDFLEWFRSARREDAAHELSAPPDGATATDPRCYNDRSLEILFGAWKRQREEATV